jgi:hypothetical protein
MLKKFDNEIEKKNQSEIKKGKWKRKKRDELEEKEEGPSLFI